jgi:hypothetical protein
MEEGSTNRRERGRFGAVQFGIWLLMAKENVLARRAELVKRGYHQLRKI